MAALVVNPSFPAKSVPEFIAYAKDNRTNVASAGVPAQEHSVIQLESSVPQAARTSRQAVEHHDVLRSVSRGFREPISSCPPMQMNRRDMPWEAGNA